MNLKKMEVDAAMLVGAIRQCQKIVVGLVSSDPLLPECELMLEELTSKARACLSGVTRFARASPSQARQRQKLLNLRTLLVDEFESGPRQAP